MCTVETAILGALGVGGQAAGFLGQQQEVDAQDERAKTVAANARASYDNQLAANARRFNQEVAASGQQAQEIAAQGAQAQGFVAASAGSRNVSGTTVADLYNSFAQEEAATQFDRSTQLEWTRDQLGDDRRAVRNQLQGLVNQNTRTTSGPSWLTLVAGSGMAVWGAYDMAAKANGKGPYDPNNSGTDWFRKWRL